MKPIVIDGRVPIYIYADNPEPEVLNQIEKIKDLPFFRDKIVIMPDCHAGKGCVIGFTGYFNEVVIPNIVGVDIGCGVYTYPLNLKVHPENPEEDINFKSLDNFIKRKIPLGLTSRKTSDAKNLPLSKKDQELLKEIRKVLIGTYKIPDLQDPLVQVGTLGSGNHFIELDIDEEGQVYLTVHSGSRNLGLKVCNFFQKKAWDYVTAKGERISKDLAYLPLKKGGKDYLKAMNLAQKYADLNRRMILKLIVEKFFQEYFDENKIIKSVHNYIDLDRDGCVRKGAISAYKDEMVVIPFNMKDGLILGKGLGNKDLNLSAPHGAGRKVSRKKAKELFDVNEFKKVMQEAKVYSSTVNKKTLDEAPFAYKDPKKILEFLPKTVKILKWLKPIYNIKGE